MIVYNLGDEVNIQLGDFYKIKEGSQGPTTRYLGADTENIQNEGGCEIWTTSSRSYITNAIENAEGLILGGGKCEVLKSNSRNPFP